MNHFNKENNRQKHNYNQFNNKHIMFNNKVNNKFNNMINSWLLLIKRMCFCKKK